ncbi:MAG: hypothetical protein MUD06_13390 [Rhodospirillales bacterium]|nr:hypothetical protein [Rhodospirillales bacterium]
MASRMIRRLRLFAAGEAIAVSRHCGRSGASTARVKAMVRISRIRTRLRLAMTWPARVPAKAGSALARAKALATTAAGMTPPAMLSAIAAAIRPAYAGCSTLASRPSRRSSVRRISQPTASAAARSSVRQSNQKERQASLVICVCQATGARTMVEMTRNASPATATIRPGVNGETRRWLSCSIRLLR